MIKSEKELIHVVWKQLGLTRHGSDLKRKSQVAREVHKAVEFMMKDEPPEQAEEIYDSLAGMFLSKIGEMGQEELAKAFYINLISSTIPKKGK